VIRVLLVVLALLALGGCAVNDQVHSNPQHQPLSLTSGDLARDGLALLTPSTVTGQEEDRQTLAILFADALARERPELRLRRLAEVLSAVNVVGITADYQRMYEDYRLTGVFDRAALRAVAEATGCRYLGQLKLARFEQGAKSRFGAFGLSIYQTQYANLRLFFQVWDSYTGAVAWEGIDELTTAVDTGREKAVTMRTAVDVAVKDLAALLP
jgi:hypothetical protein